MPLIAAAAAPPKEGALNLIDEAPRSSPGAEAPRNSPEPLAPSVDVASNADSYSAEQAVDDAVSKPRSSVAGWVAELLRQSTPAATGKPTGARVNQEATEKLQLSNSLACRGAYYAARSELVEVLQMIAAAKDALEGSSQHVRALNAGMQALDEAGDFSVSQSNLASRSDVSMCAAAHGTPLADEGGIEDLTASQAADLYLRFAQVQLGAAVSGEPAGSMALYALGKLYSRIDAANGSEDPLAQRRAFAYQQAALLSRRDNYLAAHELGVLLAETGHYHDAKWVLQQVAARRPDATVLRNLASVQSHLGLAAPAAALQRTAESLCGSNSEAQAVRWVSPSEFARLSDARGVAVRAAAAESATPSPPSQPSTPLQSATAPKTRQPWYLR
ncbi:MAG: hypothetical protein AAF961_04515 [Planctomycetota bacterium]